MSGVIQMKYRLYPISKPFVEILQNRERTFLMLLDDKQMKKQMQRMLVPYDRSVINERFSHYANDRSDVIVNHMSYIYENLFTKQRASLWIHDQYIEIEEEKNSIFWNWLYYITNDWLSIDENNKIRWVGLVKKEKIG